MTLWSGIEWGGTRSKTRKDVTLSILNSEETLHLPMEVNTKVSEVKNFLAENLGLDVDRVQFVVKSSSSYKNLRDTEEIAPKVTVKGLKSFKRPKAKYDYPVCVVGAGHQGLRLMLSFLKDGIKDFVAFERHHVVGGTAWIANANPTSKLQTELGVYHLTYAPEFDFPKDGWGLPSWPSRDQLLDHFAQLSDELGITPHVRFRTEVTAMQVITKDPAADIYSPNRQYLEVSHHPMGDDESEEVSIYSVMCCCPGSLIAPKRLEYKNEDTFGGQIGYGMFNEFDYTQVKGCSVAVMGMGAFGIENIRTCLEHYANHVTVVARRKNLVCPRVMSWFMNQSLYPPPGKQVLECFQPMYDLMYEGAGDSAWDYYAIIANKDRTIASIKQKSRFGINDVYFLAHLYGWVTLEIDTVKRLQRHTVVLESGRKVHAEQLVKVLGFKPNENVDSLMQVKEMVGFWVNGDWRRCIMCEAEGIDASKFGGTSASPGLIVNAEYQSHFVNYPKDFARVLETNMLPRNKAKPADGDFPGCPAHIYQVRMAGQISMFLTTFVPSLAERSGMYGTFNRERQLQAHPLKDFVQECAADWSKYIKIFQEMGDDREPPPYPYSVEYVKAMVKQNDSEGEAEARRQAGG